MSSVGVMARFLLAASLLFVLLSSVPVAGTVEQPNRIADINPGGLSSSPGAFVQLRGRTIFTAMDGQHGRELWFSEGLTGQTGLLADINPGTAHGIPSGYRINAKAEYDGVLFFTGTDPEHGSELWRTDGTPEGTWLVRDIDPGTAGSYPSDITVVGNIIFFLAVDSEHGVELWRTDGSGPGTTLVKDIVPGVEGIELNHPFLGAYGSLLILANNDFDNNTMTLWRSNGTEAGTVPFYGPTEISIYDPQADRTTFMVPFDGKLYLNLNTTEAGGNALYVTDGTPEGTKRVPHQFGSFPYVAYTPGRLTVANGSLYFSATDRLSLNQTPRGYSIWKITPGVERAERIIGPQNEGILGLTALDGRHMVYWQSNTTGEGKAYTLWIFDGAESKLLCSGCFDRLGFTEARFLRYVFFSADAGYDPAAAANAMELWITDGTPEGTRAFPSLSLPEKGYTGLDVFGNQLWFAGQEDTEAGIEPYLYEIPWASRVSIPIVQR